ncbi:hypothetical protein M8C21_009011 [Ambrosia artemisiifolia]|uniref:Uncharacterized protein n=1 Tax=Ambrosia artemisiifolia TaxID=4212 RepID=A0AAD5GCG0_AMBAR|nr:hypothetical protein M8C21_009011 [Ambrosia artemisiifolia]
MVVWQREGGVPVQTPGFSETGERNLEGSNDVDSESGVKKSQWSYSDSLKAGENVLLCFTADDKMELEVIQQWKNDCHSHLFKLDVFPTLKDHKRDEAGCEHRWWHIADAVGSQHPVQQVLLSIYQLLYEPF